MQSGRVFLGNLTQFLIFTVICCSRKEIEQELCALRKSISIASEALRANEAVNEQDRWNNDYDRNVDRFVAVLKNFLNSAENDFAEVEKQYGDMNIKVNLILK